MKKSFIMLLIIALIIGLVTGCSNQQEVGQQGAGDGRVLNYGLVSDIDTTDPNFSTLNVEHILFRQIYEPLYFVNYDTGDMENRLAESHKISDDGTVYTFKIKKGVKFHDGTEVKAEDVAFTIKSAAESTYIGSTVANFDSTNVIDDYTLEVKLVAPYASFLENVVQLYILPKAYYESVGPEAFAEAPIGCGAYKYIGREVGSLITLQSYKDYYRGEAPIKNVSMNIFSDAAASALALEAGDTDVYAIKAIDYERFSKMDKISLYQAKTPHITTVYMNTEIKPFDNPAVRKAVNYSLNREFMMDVNLDGLGTISSNIVSPMMFGYDENAATYDYNPEKAKQILADAGIKTPINVGKIGGSAFGEVLAPIVLENLADIGIIAEGIEITDSYIDDACKGNYEIGIMGLGVHNGVAWDMSAYSILFESEAIDAFNLPRINNPRIDELFKIGRSTANKEERLEIYKELNRIVQDDSGWAMLYSMYNILACDSNLNINFHSPGFVYINECSWK